MTDIETIAREQQVEALSLKVEDLEHEIERLRAALRQIVDDAQTRDGLLAEDASDIAHAALNPKFYQPTGGGSDRVMPDADKE